MKTNSGIILSIILTSAILGCNQTSKNNEPIELTGTVWTSVVVKDICLDTLRFHANNKVSYYSCEAEWTYSASYSIHGDSLKIGINTTQLDMVKLDPHEPISKYLMRIKESELEWLKIEHYYAGEFKEVGQDIYDNLNTFKKE